MLKMQERMSNPFYALLSLPSTAMGFALCIQISALSWLLSTRYHLDIHQIGIVWAAGPLAGIFGQVIVGVVSDKVWFWGGRRRPFILIGGALAALALLALPRIDRINDALGIGSLMAVAIAVALTLDCSINISFNPTRSIIADVTAEGHARTQGYTWMQTISGFFGVSAYVIGAVFDNYTLISLGAALVLVFSLLPPLLIEEPREMTPPAPRGEGSPSPETKAVAATEVGQLLRLYLAHAFSWIGVQTMFVYIIAFVQQRLVTAAPGPAADVQSGRIIAIAFAVLNTVGFILPAVVLDPLCKRLGRVHVHLGCVAVMSASYLAMAAVVETPLLLYVLMAGVGVGWAAIVSLPFAIMSEKVDGSRMGFFMGLFNLSVVLPQLLVSLGLGSVIKNAESKSILFLIAGATTAVSSVLWLLVREARAGRASAPIVPAGH
jgi:maltose/moltooligosaccharide transporter